MLIAVHISLAVLFDVLVVSALTVITVAATSIADTELPTVVVPPLVVAVAIDGNMDTFV